MTTVASPSTRKYALERGIDPEALARRTGRSFLTREDIDAALSPGPAQTAAPPSPWETDHALYGPVEFEPRSRFSRIAAANLAVSASTIPAVTHHDAADMGAIDALRHELRPEADARGVKLTVLAFHILALTRTLDAFPRFNASLSADGGGLWLKRHVAIGVAVDTPHGLVVPVLRGLQRRKIWSIATGIADLAARARARKLRPEEMGGASMSVSSLGGIGGRGFTPIINPPELAILGLSRARVEPVWDGEAFQPRAMCPLDLTYDHRVIDGAQAAAFLRHYADLLEAPARLML
ncbi:2-oxo acid dehydrogenase subunit E2 [Pararhodobacter sp.]|uniref:2-oxo acid dehydrogenase subunit E2 n=1 Tax=Pararhodobacter sp. TaxID=2127056 RepID=UPI002FDEC08D